MVLPAGFVCPIYSVSKYTKLQPNTASIPFCYFVMAQSNSGGSSILQWALSAIVVSSTICYRKQWQLFYLEGIKKIILAKKAYFILVVKTKCYLYCFKPDKEALWVTNPRCANSITASVTRKTNFQKSHGSTRLNTGRLL